MSYPFLKSETFGLRTQETFVGNKCEIYVPDFFFNKDDDNALATDSFPIPVLFCRKKEIYS